MSKAKSLDALYDSGKYHYWCNAAGDINIPGADPLDFGTIDQMPAPAAALYKNVWSDQNRLLSYVLEVEGRYGMALSVLFNEDAIHDLCKLSKFIDRAPKSKRGAFSLVSRVADDWVDKLPLAEVYVGENTDPDGHEIVVFVPDSVADIAKTFKECDALCDQMLKACFVAPKMVETWCRIGVSLNATEQELTDILTGSRRAGRKAMTQIITSGRATPNGETYFPDEVLDDLATKLGLSYEKANDINCEVDLDPKDFVEPELAYILDFAQRMREEGCSTSEPARSQLRSLWTAYILHTVLIPDTMQYDDALRKVWEAMGAEDTEDGTDYDSFELYMIEFLV